MKNTLSKEEKKIRYMLTRLISELYQYLTCMEIKLNSGMIEFSNIAEYRLYVINYNYTLQRMITEILMEMEYTEDCDEIDTLRKWIYEDLQTCLTLAFEKELEYLQCMEDEVFDYVACGIFSLQDIRDKYLKDDYVDTMTDLFYSLMEINIEA